MPARSALRSAAFARAMSCARRPATYPAIRPWARSGTRTKRSAWRSAASAARRSPRATAGKRRSLTAASWRWSAALAAFAIRATVGSCSAATAAAPRSERATPCSHSALYRGERVATYSAWAAICCCVPRSCSPAPATARSQAVAARQAWPADDVKPSATASATAKIAVTAAKPSARRRPTVILSRVPSIPGSSA